jgi:hypothetical protein
LPSSETERPDLFLANTLVIASEIERLRCDPAALTRLIMRLALPDFMEPAEVKRPDLEAIGQRYELEQDDPLGYGLASRCAYLHGDGDILDDLKELLDYAKQLEERYSK